MIYDDPEERFPDDGDPMLVYERDGKLYMITAPIRDILVCAQRTVFQDAEPSPDVQRIFDLRSRDLESILKHEDVSV